MVVVAAVVEVVAVAEGAAAAESVNLVDTPRCPLEDTPRLEEAEAFLGEALVEELPGAAMEAALAAAAAEGLAMGATGEWVVGVMEEE